MARPPGQPLAQLTCLIEQHQLDGLRALSASTKVPQAALVREALDELLRRYELLVPAKAEVQS